MVAVVSLTQCLLLDLNDVNTLISRRLLGILMFTLVLILSNHNQLLLGQSDGFLTYEDPEIGITFEYPSEWSVKKGFLEFDIDIEEGIAFKVQASLNPVYDDLRGFARYQYEHQNFDAFSPTILNDNQTTVNNGHAAIQMEYEFKFADTNTRQGLALWTVAGGVGYQFNYVADKGNQFDRNIPAIREMLNSIEFIPLPPPPKQPSFTN
jgi:hypothetical protein